MSRLKELLKDIPVVREDLGNLCKVLRGRRLTKKQLSTNEIHPVFHGGLEPLGYYSKSNRLANSVMIINVGASAGKVGYSSVEFWSSDGCYCLEHSDVLNSRYLYYYLLGQEYFLKSRVRYAGIPTLDAVIIEKVQIPIPFPNDTQKSLEVQQEIVRVLDSLYEQTNELKDNIDQECSDRFKQYTYFREHLFYTKDSSAPHLPLGNESIGKFTRGSGLQKKDFTDNGVGCIHYGQIYTYYGTAATKTKSFVSLEFARKTRKAKKGNLIIATTSENDEDVCKAVAWLGSEDIAVSSDACFYSHNLNPKYVSYYFQTEQFQKQKRKYITGIKVRRVNVNDLEKILIPVPKIEEQNRIVELLDAYETACKAIKKELNQEIDFRNKQYEYYRNFLLTFQKEN